MRAPQAESGDEPGHTELRDATRDDKPRIPPGAARLKTLFWVTCAKWKVCYNDSYANIIKDTHTHENVFWFGSAVLMFQKRRDV